MYQCVNLWCFAFGFLELKNEDIILKYKRITPAVITTTSCLASLGIIELIKHLIKKEPL